MTQIEIHKKIEEFLKAGVKAANIDVAKELQDYNIDSRNYFFAQANESWLTWLWDNGFLNKLKEKAEDLSSYSYQMPELQYLSRMAEKDSAKVAEIILSIPISVETFNPEVVDRFIWIIEGMPVEQIKTIIGKMKDERWIYLMRKFGRSAYQLDKMVKKIVAAKEYEALLVVAQIMLEVRSQDDFDLTKASYSIENPFYLEHISDIGFFEELVNVDDANSEEFLKIAVKMLGYIVKLKGKSNNKVFEYENSFSLYDADLFEVGFKRRSISSREDVENLVVAIKLLIEKIIAKNKNDAVVVNRILVLIKDLPENRLVWRLRMFTLAQCPEIFKDEIKTALLRVFQPEVGERYFEITGGAEYEQVLARCFKILNESDQREYVEKVFEYFNADLGGADKKEWRRRDGGKILCFIPESVAVKEKIEEIKEVFGITPGEEKCVPEPIMKMGEVGSVNHKSPEDVSVLSIDQIVERLKSDLSPEQLKEKYNNDDFLNPRGAEGLGDALRDDFKKRPVEYFDNILKFFDRENIAPNYVYSVLRGVEEMLRDKIKLEQKQIEQVLNLFELIKLSGEAAAFKKNNEKDGRSWLADWITVHRVMADIMLLALENKDEKEKIQADNRSKIKNVISYLLAIKESPRKEDEKPEYGELFNVAINSVRGRAYEAFVMFAQNDGKELVDDVKEIYAKTLADDSLAIRFVIGHYLATFYFRDKDFIVKLFPEIFPKENAAKIDIYLASWEGYLSNTLYDKLFVELKGYYKYAISLNSSEYTDRKYQKGLDEALAVHIALAFAHLGLEQNNELFQLFWATPSIKRHQEFVSFIGRSCLSRDQAGDEWLKENKVSKKKLLGFWDWILEKKDVEPEVLSGFGYWINRDVEILPDSDVIERIATTLKKSEGNISWDYNLLRRLPIFAEKNQEKTLEIISSYLLDSSGNNLNLNRRTPFLYDDEIKEALKIIYKKETLRPRVVSLINTLIEKGSSTFWDFKEVII